MTTETQTPDDWVLLEAAKRCEMGDHHADQLRFLYKRNKIYRALCDMIQKYEKPPVDRKVLCAQEALAGSYLRMGHWVRIRKGEADTDIELTTIIRAIELYEEGFGK